MKRSRTIVAALAMAVGLLVANAPAAHAAAAANFPGSCFGYSGTFRSGSHILHLDLQDPGGAWWTECFGIGTDRRIFHAWPNSGGWRVMPNNGLADDVDYGFYDSRGHRTIKVLVRNSSGGYGEYCSTLNPTWRPWVEC
jgi:hypothetical protein